MTTTTLDSARFDHPDNLNDDGTVTLRFSPSTWHAYNVSPDTYQTFTGDSWLESEIEWLSEQEGREITWEDYDAEYDHVAIVRSLAEEACDWIVETLWDIGLESVANGKVIDSWSPVAYNFTSDGFEMTVDVDPEELRALTPDFDVDAFGHENYSSYDGFHSFVTGRLNESDWRMEYDGAFRIESLLAAHDPHHNRDWIMRLAEVEWEVYMEHVTITLKPIEESTAWGEDTVMMQNYALELTRAMAGEGQESLDI
jgi:hypothetical protein